MNAKAESDDLYLLRGGITITVNGMAQAVYANVLRSLAACFAYIMMNISK